MEAVPAAGLKRAPLTSVVFVWRSALPHLDVADTAVWHVDAYLDESARWTVPRVVEKAPPGELRLLPRVAAQEPLDLDPIVKRKRFADALALACRRGDLEVVTWLVETYCPDGRIRGSVEDAAMHGHVHLLQWLHDNHRARVVWSIRGFFAACIGGHLEAVVWMHENGPTPQRDCLEGAFIQAATTGHAAVTQWLCTSGLISPNARAFRKRRPQMDQWVEKAAKHGTIEALECLSATFSRPCPVRCMGAAVGYGNLDMARWLKMKHHIETVGRSALVRAVKCGHLQTIVWSIKNLEITGDKSRVHLIDQAAASGHMEIVQFLHTHSSESCSVDAIDSAAGGGFLDIVKWLHSHRSEGCTTKAMDSAAAGGHLDVVEWLHANRTEGCTERAMNDAAGNNDFRVVEWLHLRRTEGCSRSAMDAAATNGHLEMVKWLHTNRDGGCTYSAMDGAIANGHLEIVKWLHYNKAADIHASTWLDKAAANGHLDVLRWIQANRQTMCSSDAIRNAAANGHLDVVQWLHRNTQRVHVLIGSYDMLYGLNSAIINGHLSVVKYILGHTITKPYNTTVSYTASHGQVEVAKELQAAEFDDFSLECFEAAMRNAECEMLQFLVREYADRVPGAKALIQQYCDSHAWREYCSQYLQDCLDELATLGSWPAAGTLQN